MGGVEGRLKRLERGGAAGVSEATVWAEIVEAAWAGREGRAYTVPPAVAEAMNRPPRPGGFLELVQRAHQQRTEQETA